MEVQNTVIKRISTPKTTKNKFSRFFRQLKIPRQYFSLKYPPIFRVFFVFFVFPKTPLFFAKNFAKNRPVPSCNWGQEVSPFVVQVIGKQRMVGDTLDFQTRFRNCSGYKVSNAYARCVQFC